MGRVVLQDALALERCLCVEHFLGGKMAYLIAGAEYYNISFGQSQWLSSDLIIRFAEFLADGDIGRFE